MSRSFTMPDLGEGIYEAEVITVLVSVGAMVKEGDPILEVETDKAAVEIPSPFTGTIEKILVKPGDVIRVNDMLMIFSNGKEVKSIQKEKSAEIPIEATGPDDSMAEPAKKLLPVPTSPATRRLARELGVDLHQVPPTGPEGLVTAEDVRAFAEKKVKAIKAPEIEKEKPAKSSPVLPALPPLPEFKKWGPVERVPVRSIRRATAKQMALAWAQIPHVNSQDMVDITTIEAFRQKHKAEIEALGGKLTLTVFALKAVATALKTYPNFNASLDIEAGEIIVKHYYNIGIAIDTNEGLIVPVIRDVDRKSIRELSIELTDLVQRTRARKAVLEEMQGGTFTITNVGHRGGGHFSPLINYPEVAILGMGAARLQPVVKEKQENEHEIIPRLMMPIVLCFDHRVLDGADAMRFMRMIIDALEDPDELLITMI